MASIFTEGERALMRREGQRITDIVLGRADNRTQVCHYLVIERMDPEQSYAPDVREIEQYRDIERVYANARDCETGNRRARCLGAFTLTFCNGKLAKAPELIDLTATTEIEVPPQKSRNVLVSADR